MTGKKIGFGELVQSFGAGLAPPTDQTQHVLIHTPAVAPLALASPEALRPAVTGSLPFRWISARARRRGLSVSQSN